MRITKSITQQDTQYNPEARNESQGLLDWLWFCRPSSRRAARHRLRAASHLALTLWPRPGLQYLQKGEEEMFSSSLIQLAEKFQSPLSPVSVSKAEKLQVLNEAVK